MAETKITINSKTTETLWEAHKTISNNEELKSFLKNLSSSQKKEEKTLFDSLTYGLKDVKDNAALIVAVKNTLEKKNVMKDAGKEWYHWIEFATADGPFNIHLHEDLLQNRYKEVALSKEETVEKHHLEELKAEKIKEKKEKKENEELTSEELEELKTIASNKFNVWTVVAWRSTVAPAAEIAAVEFKLSDPTTWAAGFAGIEKWLNAAIEFFMGNAETGKKSFLERIKTLLPKKKTVIENGKEVIAAVEKVTDK